jgi:hypothetical protein
MNRFSLRNILAVVVGGLVIAASSRATTITFDSVVSSGNPVKTTVTTSGFTFTSDYFHTIDNPAIGSFGGLVSDGSIFISEEAGILGQPITMALSGGGAFSLSSLFGSKVFANSSAAATGGFPNADVLNILGNLSGGGTVSATFSLGGAFQQFFLPSTFTGLTSVVFSGSLTAGGAGGISLDTIVANSAAVPDGGNTGLWLFLTMIGLGWLAKKASRSRSEVACQPVRRRRSNRTAAK